MAKACPAIPGAGTRLTLFLCLLAAPCLAQVEDETWTLSTRLRRTYADNIFLVPGGPSDSITTATLQLFYRRVDRRGILGGLGWLRGGIFDHFQARDDIHYGLHVAGATGLERRARLRMAASYNQGFNLEAPYISRFVLPQLGVRSASFTSGFTYRLDPKSSFDAVIDASAFNYRSDTLLHTAALPGGFPAPVDVTAPSTAPAFDLLASDGSLEVLDLLAIEGLVTTRIDYWSTRVGGALTHQFSPRTQGSLGLDYRHSHHTPADFADGDQRGAQLALRQRLDDTAELALTYAYQDSQFQGLRQTHAFTLQVQKQFGRRVRTDASVGISNLHAPEPASSSWTFLGGGGGSLRLRRLLLTAHLSRTQYQAVIVQRTLVSDTVDAELSYRLARYLVFASAGSYRRGRDLFVASNSYHAVQADAALVARIKKRADATVSYSYLRFRSPLALTTDRSVVSLSLGYARSAK